MAESNEQDPITGRKLPRLVNYNNQTSVVPNNNYGDIKLPTVNRNFNTSGVQLVDYTESGYDNPGGTYVEDLPNLNSIRAKNQGFFSTLGNGLGRAALNIIPTIVGNVASILDFEDYVNKDNEVGNSITRAMEEFKQTVNQDILPIYQENPGEAFNISDSAWWIENGSSLVESIGAFAATGAGIGALFKTAGKGLSMINGLSKLGNAGKAAATILSATGLNQAESITTAMQVYDTTYQAAVENGQSEEQAKQSAADAASYSVNINRANIALNLTSAGAFIRSPKMTRQIREAFTGTGRKQILNEGLQEYGEETLNYIAQKEGERLGQAKATGKEYSYDFKNTVKDALSAEGIESGVLGFIGGAGQTGLTRAYNRMTGEGQRQDDLYNNQQESIARIQGLQNAGVVPNVTNIFNSIEKNTKLQNDIDNAITAGNDLEAKRLQYQLLNQQLADSLENGTVDQLESVYTDIEGLTSEEAQNKGLEVDPKSPYNYKKKAAEAIQLIKDAEDGYLDIANKGYVNPDEVLDTYIQNKVLSRLLNSTIQEANPIHTEALNDKVNLGIQADLNSENPPKELTDLPSYQNYKLYQNMLDIIRKEVVDNNAKYAELTSNEYQEKLFNERQEKLKKGLEEAEIKLKKEADKEVKKRQKEVKKKVDESKEEVPFDDVPMPDLENDTTSDDDLFNLEEAELEVTDIPEESSIPLEENSLEPEVTDPDYITPEEQTTANIVEQEEVNEAVKQDKEDGKVKPVDLDKANNHIKFENLTRQRDVANTIISLNVEYIETVSAGEEGINTISIQDRYDEDGELLINENFDSRLQSPNQFEVGQDVNIIIPSFEQIGGTFLEREYNQAIDSIDSFPIAFTDNTGKIIGFLPTQDNVRRRVNEDFREVELIKNKELRELIFNNRDTNYTVKITRKSPGSLLVNKSTKSLYNALGDGTKLANDVSIGIYKDSMLQTSLGSATTKSLINKSDLQTGYIYSILPTAESGNYIATPMDINSIGEDNARTVLKLVQLYKASDRTNAHKDLVIERNELAREIDLSNTNQLNDVISTIMYTSSSDSNYMFKLGKTKLVLGTTSDMNFTWDDVMSNPITQARIVDILSNRYHAVQLSKFGQRFNQYKVNQDNKIEQIRHNNYFDYLNSDNVIKTNVQGFPITGENNQYYFTGQSVIEFSNPIIEEAEPATKVVETRQVAEKSTKAKNKLGVKYKPNIINNKVNILDDLPEVYSNVEGFKKSLDNIKDDYQYIIYTDVTKKLVNAYQKAFNKPVTDFEYKDVYKVIAFVDPMNKDIFGAMLNDPKGAKKYISDIYDRNRGFFISSLEYKREIQSKNRPQIEEDFNYIASQSNKSLDDQAKDLIKKCGS